MIHTLSTSIHYSNICCCPLGAQCHGVLGPTGECVRPPAALQSPLSGLNWPQPDPPRCSLGTEWGYPRQAPERPRGASHPGAVPLDLILLAPSAPRPWHHPGERDGAGTITRLVVSGGHKPAFTSPQPRVCAAWRQREQAQCPAGEDTAPATPTVGGGQRHPATARLGACAQAGRPHPSAPQSRETLGLRSTPQGWGGTCPRGGRAPVQPQRASYDSPAGAVTKCPKLSSSTAT